MKKILVAEDQKEFADPLKEFLMSSGFEVEVVDRGFNVVAVALNFRPDLIILDVFFDHTDNADGEKIALDLEENVQLSKIPLLITTAYLKADDVVAENERLRGLGAKRRYLGKGIDPEDVLQAVKDLLVQ